MTVKLPEGVIVESGWTQVTVEEFAGLERVATFRRACWTGSERLPMQDMPKIGLIIGGKSLSYPLSQEGEGEDIEAPYEPPNCRILSFVHIVKRKGQFYATFSYGTQHAAPMGLPPYRAHAYVFLTPVSSEMIRELVREDLVTDPVDIEMSGGVTVSRDMLPRFIREGTARFGAVIREQGGTVEELPNTAIISKGPIDE